MSIYNILRLKLSYAYRLLAAKLAIRRQRKNRMRQNRVTSTSAGAKSSSPVRLSKGKRFATRFFAISAIALGLASLFQTGYWLGSRNIADKADARLTQQSEPEHQRPPQSLEIAKKDQLTDLEIMKIDANPTTSDAQGSDMLYNRSQIELGLAQQAMLAVQREVDSQQRTIARQLDKITSLENETLALESLLLEKDAALAKSEKAIANAGVERRVVYNFTNVPIGSHKADEENERAQTSLIASDTKPQPLQFNSPTPNLTDAESYSQSTSLDDINTYSQSNGEIERWQGDQYLADMMKRDALEGMEQNTSDPINDFDEDHTQAAGDNSPPVETGIQQRSFYGPAPDRYEDRISPTMAHTPYTH